MPSKGVLEIVISKIKAVWLKASIPQIIQDTSLRNKLNKSIDRYRTVQRAIASKNNPSLIQEFKADCDKLFDICTCQCKPADLKNIRGKMLCSCPEKRRLFFKEVDFLNDQRTERDKRISDKIDKQTTAEYGRSQARSTRDEVNAPIIAPSTSSSSVSDRDSSVLLAKRPRPSYKEEHMCIDDKQLYLSASTVGSNNNDDEDSNKFKFKFLSFRT